jgi:hypothetical protein
VKKILILTANPKNTDKLRLDEEVREIQAGLERARKRDRFEIVTRWALRVDDLRRALLDHEPQIVHFSGHGGGKHGLALENSSGQMQLVSTESLARLFNLFKDKIECVVFNACYSEAQAEAIHQHINCVVGMNKAFGDRAAIEFAVGFYDALGAGKSYEVAYEFGCSAIDLESIPESATPVLRTRQRTDNVSNPAPTLPPVKPDKLVTSEGNRAINPPPTSQDSKPDEPERLPPNPDIVLEDPEGLVPLDSKFYVERSPIETDCYERIVRPGSLIRIKAPGHMGKSSLMARILNYAKQQGYQTADVNFRLVDDEFWTSLDQFLPWFCASVTEAMELPDKLADYWKGVLGSKNKSMKYFERYLLAECDKPLVLGLDNVDEIFPHGEIATGFFGLLRTWHEQGKNEELWKKLRLVIVHSKEVYIPMQANQSPFNVGFAAELRELNQAEVQDLVQQHGLHWTEQQVGQLTQLVGGHPYLLRVALYQFARQRMSVEELLQAAPTEGGLYGEHLRRHYLNVKSDDKLVAALRQVVSANEPIQVGTEEAFRLQSLGLVKYQGNAIAPSCELYRRYFRDHL